MPRYAKTKYRLGAWWLDQRANSPAWYRCTLEGKQVRRVSLGTADFEDAKRIFTNWWRDNITLEADGKPLDQVNLIDVLRDYHANHGKSLHSWHASRSMLGHWQEFWGDDATLNDVRSMPRQEEFKAFLFAKGFKQATVARYIELGRTAIRRAWKRGVVVSLPYVDVPPYGETDPKGRPLSVEELQKLYSAATPHLRLFIMLMVGTAARPSAILQLTWAQIDFQTGLITLNPPGRKQTAKRRPVVRMPNLLRNELAPTHHKWVVMFRGEPLKRIDHAFRIAAGKAKLEGNVSAYSLRHTCARWMRQQGVPVDQIASQLGHTMPEYSMSLRYMPNSPDYQEKSCKALNALLGSFLLGHENSQASAAA
jgi:integrase